MFQHILSIFAKKSFPLKGQNFILGGGGTNFSNPSFLQRTIYFLISEFSP